MGVGVKECRERKKSATIQQKSSSTTAITRNSKQQQQQQQQKSSIEKCQQTKVTQNTQSDKGNDAHDDDSASRAGSKNA